MSGGINATHVPPTCNAPLHYTYDVPDDHSVDDLQCPVCGGSDCLEEIQL
ncbi:MAG: hypothetical protein V5A28_14210 [Haloarculaceae archaeon]